MKDKIRRSHIATCTLLLTLTVMFCLPSIDKGWAEDKTANVAGADTDRENSLDVRGEVTNPRRINAAELGKLPRVEMRVTDAHDPGKEIVYAGPPLFEVLKAGGLRLDSGEAGFREAVAITVLVEAADGYRVVFALAELDPDIADRVILLADTKDGQPLPSREGPFRIIVPGEKRPTRWVRQVAAVTVGKN